jgi:hypothetical protein
MPQHVSALYGAAFLVCVVEVLRIKAIRRRLSQLQARLEILMGFGSASPDASI